MSQSLVCVEDFEKYAQSVLPKMVFDFYKGGAGAEETLADNKIAYSRLKIRPRCLRNVAKIRLSTTILGKTIELPIGIAPTGMQRMAHPEGECATARAAQLMGTIFTLSTGSNASIEEVAAAVPHCRKWFQLYIYNDRNITRNLVQRAEKCGYEAIVLTVDLPIVGRRLSDIRNKFSLPSYLKLANFDDDKTAKVDKSVDGSSLSSYVNSFFDPSLDWNDVKWLKSITKLPVILKGILTAEDAILGADLGVAAIWVSNHGARQIDGTAATIEALPEIVKAVGSRVEVYLDGGITNGTSVFKALALGAKMVFAGRPFLWGLTHSGEKGAKKVLSILKTDLNHTLAMTGCQSIFEITKEMIVHESFYNKL